MGALGAVYRTGGTGGSDYSVNKKQRALPERTNPVAARQQGCEISTLRGQNGTPYQTT